MPKLIGTNRQGFANSAVARTESIAVSSDIALYLPFDSDLNDDSTNAFTGTAVNGASISTSVKKIGSGSLDLVSSGKYVNYPYNSDFDLGSDNWTFEAWIYQTTSDVAALFSQYAGGSGSTDYNYAFTINNNSPNRGFQFNWHRSDNGSDAHGFSSLNPIINTWNHVALVREGNYVKCYLNGVVDPSTANFSATIRSSGSDNFSVGRSAIAGYRGYIDDFRFTKGVAVYTSNFTPPTSSAGGNSITVENKFLSSVWSLKDQNKKISKGEWIRNDVADTGANAKGRTIKGSGLEVQGHRHYSGPGITASGGSESETPTHKYHMFTSPGTFNMTGAQGQVEYLVIGGGGGGGAGSNYTPQGLGGGGGAGGLRTGFLDPLTPGTYPVTVGNNGSGGSYQSGTSGQPSSFATITAAGGGGGGRGRPTESGLTGGSGGGHGATYSSSSPFPTGAAGNTPPTTPPQGNPGGAGPSSIPGSHPEPNVHGRTVAAGGGGSGGPGFDAGSGLGHGGVGTPLPQFPSTMGGFASNDTYYATGPNNIWASGGGAGNDKPGPRGQYLGGVGGPQSTHPNNDGQGPGGGGYGANPAANATNGSRNTGGGGGGGINTGSSHRNGGDGGTGIVIIRYLKP